MEEREDVEEDVELVGDPEEVEGLLPHDRVGEDEDDHHDQVQADASQAGQGLRKRNTINIGP